MSCLLAFSVFQLALQFKGWEDKKYIQCSVCSKNIRSDKMKFHKHERGGLQYKKKTCPTCKTSMKAGNLSRHMRKHDKQLHLDLIEELERGKEKKKKDYERPHP